jgi:hypothetical protein
MPQIITCPACGGARGTEKVQHTVETDSQGNQVPREHRYWSPCTYCSGSGTVVQ